MRTIHEHSAGVIPFRRPEGSALVPLYLVIHSATVRNPRARWEFPKGGIEPGESARQAAAREFVEEGDRHQVVGFPRGVRAYSHLHLHSPRPETKQDRHLLSCRSLRRLRLEMLTGTHGGPFGPLEPLGIL